MKIKDKDRSQMLGVTMKSAQVATLEVNDKEMELINKLTLEPLGAEQVFAFKVAMCDNEIDRTFEVFPTSTLNKLKDFFVGRTMIKDHSRTADNQIARVYATEVVEHINKSRTGENYSQLIAHCYMLDTTANQGIISDIKYGIKKEVSVSVRIGKAVCSICGMDNFKSSCSHWWGETYEGKVCHFSLEDPTDAYELSFVAVPAQPNAGTMKNYGLDKPEAEEPQLEEIEKEAEVDQDQIIKTKIKALDAFIYSQNIQKTEGETNK